MPTVLCTSSSRGLGREFVRQYAADGWRVIAACRHPELAGDDLRGLGDEVRPIAMDVSDLAAVEAVAREEEAPLDLLLNTAGIIGQLDDGPGNVQYAEWTRVLDVNVLGPVRVLDAFADRLAAEGGGRAVTLTSAMGSISRLGAGPVGAMMYRTSKAAVNMAMAVRARELSARGVSVAVLNPGWVRTDMGGPGARLGVEESIAAMRRVIDRLGPGQAGHFLDVEGGEIP